MKSERNTPIDSELHYSYSHQKCKRLHKQHVSENANMSYNLELTSDF